MEVIKPIIALVGGGAAGYITNDYAVKMLFRKYGPLGGMIIETREQFVESMSKLVERDIINNHTIENELSKHEFRRVFYNLVSDVLKTHLYNNTADIDIIKIPGMRDSINNFIGFYKENVSGLAGDFFKTLLENIQLEDVLGEKQRVFLADNLWEILLNELTENDAIENIMKGFYRENKEKPLDEWINPKLFKSVALNVTACTSNLHETLQSDFNDEIDELIKNMYDKLDCNGILKKFENDIKDKTLMEIFSKESAENIANEILERGIKLLKSPEGKALLHDFSVKIFDILKSINVSVMSLLDDGIRSKLEGYMREHLPAVIEKIIRWLKSNKSEIENLINDSIDDVLEDGSSGFFNVKGKLKKAFKNLAYENLAGKVELVKHIIAYIEEGTDVRSMSIEVADSIITYISKNTVSEIIIDLEKKKVLRPEYITSLINHNIDTQISKMNISMFDAFFQNRVGDIVKSDFSHHFENFIKNTLMRELKSNFLFTDKCTRILQREVSNKIIELGTAKIGKIINDDSCNDLAKLSKDKIIAELTESKSKMVNLLAKGIQDEISGKYMGSFCNDDMIQKMGKSVANKSLPYLREKISDGQNQPIKEVYDHLNAQKDSVKNLTGLVIELSNKNLHLLLEGKIQETVSTNLSKLPDVEIQSIVENFMGKELKPINLFGAILGSTAGLLTYFAESGLQLANNPATELAFTVSVYGFVGYITNVIALKMIFQPYYEKKLMGVKVPFTPGVVTKQKPRFAASMGEFVDQSLLKASAVNEIFQEKRAMIESNFIKTISADDYKLLQKVLIENNELISSKVLALTLQFIDKNKEVFFDNMIGELKEVDLAKFDYTTLQFAIQDKSRSCIKNTDDVISEQLNKVLQSGKSLNAMLPDSMKKAMYDSMNQMLGEKIQGMIKLIDDDSNIEKMVADFAKSFDILVEKNINEQLGEGECTKIKDVVSDYFVQKTQSKEVREALLDWIDEKIGKELTPEKRIGDLFGGMLIRILHQNAQFMLDSIIGAAQSRLQNNHDSIKREAYGVSARNI